MANSKSNAIKCSLMLLFVGACLAVATGIAYAQAGFPPPPPKVSPIAGAIDMHIHPGPDIFVRSLTDTEMAMIAKRQGMRGIVLKNHVAPTADRAALAMQQVPGIEVWGGVVLNNAVGGINPAAVEWMYRMEGGCGKVVWLPTFDSDMHIKTLVDKNKSGIVVAPNGKVTPATEEVLKIIARENLVLATGHIHPEEVVAVVKRARELGVKNIIVTHAFTRIPGLTMAQAKDVAAMGAMIEICYQQFLAGPNSQFPWLRSWGQTDEKTVAMAVKEIGAKNLVLSTDLGAQDLPIPTDGLIAAVQAIKREGVSDADIDLMIRKNPARLLGLTE